ncbi:MAG TPA: LytTR family DNA-binding domain-containing protein [Bacteroidales bacterium]|nr:LytTR family DNA-binding domain-containing protein [Bacteroidales bacterium]
MKSTEGTEFNHADQKIALPDKHGMGFFELNKIVRCQSENSYTHFFIQDSFGKGNPILRIIVSKGFEHYESFLLSKGFFYRVHNQHIININRIKRYTNSNGGYLLMDDDSGYRIPIARARKEGFMNHLITYGIILK